MSSSNAILERDIFGGSDSDLSSDENDDQQYQRQVQRPPVRQETQPDSSEGGVSGDEYQDVDSNRRISSTKKKSRKSRDNAEDDDGERPRRARTAQKRKRKQPIEVDLNDLPPEQASRLRLDMQIEAIFKPKKGKGRKSGKKDAEEEALDRVADEEVSRLRDAMNVAFDEDKQLNEAKLPATSKLRMLPQVIEVLRKSSLTQSIIDNNLLESVAKWLEPLPDKSLPALNIQREIFPILKKMDFIDGAVLREAELGKIVLFYTKCKRVTPDISRIANDLVSAWSRPIIKRSASYRDRKVPIAQGAETSGGGTEKLNSILARAKDDEKGRVKRNAVMIPQRNLGAYTIAPKAGFGKSNVSVDADVQRRRANADRLRMLSRKANTNKT